MSDSFKCETRNPIDPAGERIEVVIPGELIERQYKYQSVAYENFRAVKYVLENVDGIFAGVRDFNQGGWCYVGRPQHWFIRPSVEVSFPSELVYAVYINPNLRVYEHRAEHLELGSKFCPKDWRDRYKGLIWSITF